MSSLATRLNDFITAVGADIKSLRTRVDAPSYMPSTALHRWEADTSSYNFTKDTLHQYRGSVSKLIQGTADLDIVAVFDSTGTGYNGVTPVTQATFKYANCIPYNVGKAMAAMLGVPFGGGMQACVSANGSVNDRWTLTGAATAGAAFIISSGVGTAEWLAIDQGTQVDLVYSNLQTNGLAWTIDGVTQTPLVTDGSSTMRKVTVTGLTNGIHKVKVTAAAGNTMLLYLIGVRNPGVKSLYVHNLALGGSRANSGNNDQNWSSVASTAPAGLGFTHVGGFNLLGFTVALVLCCVGNNDVFQTIAPATVITGIANIRAYWSTAPFAFLHPPMVPGTNTTNFDTFCTSIFTQIDAMTASSYLDWNDLVGGTAGFTADGQAGPDGVHPIWGHAMMIGRLWAGLFAKSVMPVQPYAAYRVADGGLRPNVPAGQVVFSQQAQPTDWTDGDGWDDLP